jgi:hypothetical protein
MRDERAHPARRGERQRPSVVSFAPVGIELVGMSRDVAEQVPCVSRKPGMRRQGFDRPVGDALRVPQPAEPQTGASYGATSRFY